jgi:hypothetical protein
MNVGSRATTATRRGRDTVHLEAGNRLERIHRVLLSRTRRAGEARPPTIATGAAITLRLAGRDDEAAIERLAQLCEGARPPGPSLVAEVDGQIQAALPCVSRELLSDPYIPMAELRSLLRLRAAQLDASDPAWVCADTAEIVPLPKAREYEQIAPQARGPAEAVSRSGDLLASNLPVGR